MTEDDGSTWTGIARVGDNNDEEATPAYGKRSTDATPVSLARLGSGKRQRQNRLTVCIRNGS